MTKNKPKAKKNVAKKNNFQSIKDAFNNFAPLALLSIGASVVLAGAILEKPVPKYESVEWPVVYVEPEKESNPVAAEVKETPPVEVAIETPKQSEVEEIKEGTSGLPVEPTIEPEVVVPTAPAIEWPVVQKPTPMPESQKVESVEAAPSDGIVEKEVKVEDVPPVVVHYDPVVDTTIAEPKPEKKATVKKKTTKKKKVEKKKTKANKKAIDKSAGDIFMENFTRGNGF